MSPFLRALPPVISCLLLFSPLAAARPDQLPSGDEVAVIIRMREQAALADTSGASRTERLARTVQDLKATAARTQGELLDFLGQQGAHRAESLWIVNSVAATIRADLLPLLPALPGVAEVTPDTILHAPASLPAPVALPRWNIAALHAPQVWNLGYRGKGVVVANMDTGVDVAHPDLKGKWRGGKNSWHDPWKSSALPYDAIGHGTQTMGLMVGGSHIGVAPAARWIAAKIYDDDGNTTLSTIHHAFQWLLDPDGNAETPDAPDVVDASWGLEGVNACDLGFDSDLRAMDAAGIFVAFAAGNAGPAPMTSLSPANNPGAFAVGAVDAGLAVCSFSSRGPSACGGSLFPDVVAPGEGVLTTDISLAGSAQYTVVSGTSFAAAEATGVAALLLDAFPGLPVVVLSHALTRRARDLGVLGPDNDNGHGLLDAFASHRLLAATVPLAVATELLSPAVQARGYRASLEARGGRAPYRWKIVAGNLPPGIALDPWQGVLAGQPKRSGVFSFRMRVVDARGIQACRNLLLKVHPPAAKTSGGWPAYFTPLHSEAAQRCLDGGFPDRGLRKARSTLLGSPTEGKPADERLSAAAVEEV